MFRDLIELLKELIKKLVTSRIFALSVIFFVMFGVLSAKLFQMQIIDGEKYLADYIQKTKKTVSIPSTRGNIYDRKGNILAYNKLAYSVTIQDTGAYTKAATRNAMLLELITILDGHGETVQGKFEVAIDSNGDMVYTSTSEDSRKRFLRDFYGRSKVDELDDEKNKYPSNVSARELFEKKKKSYELEEMKDERGNPIILTDEQALKIINIRYTMSLTAYQKYETTTVASYVSDETVADILEHTSDLQGVGVEEATIRVYNDSIYFSPIIGYTGKIQEDRLEELKKTSSNYELTDVVGRTGIEASMELDLQGMKGEKTMFVDNMGRILEVTEQTDPVAGKDVYLTLDRDLQIGIYRLIEQQLAGILADKLVNSEVIITPRTDSTNMKIPIKDAYYQLINNNVLSLNDMRAEDASEIEKEIHRKYTVSEEQILNQIRGELESSQPTPKMSLPEDMAAYMDYIYSYLSDPNVGIMIKSSIDTNSADYKAWVDGSYSLRQFIYAGIANSWVDTTKLEIESKYSHEDDVYKVLIDIVMEELKDDTKFAKKIYRYLINNETITGKDLCLALYAQEVLPYDEEEIQMLTTNGDNYAYTFIIKKISNIEITPAQLALDPYAGACVVTDVNTGEVRALVTYPSYDNNRLSGTVDAGYYNQLLDDLSLPLWNNATQVVKAPGSTFKPITAVAALEEHVIDLDDKVDCTGIYGVNKEIDKPIKCWISPGHHGQLDIVGGIQNSCNYFFADMAHRLSTDEKGNYSPDRGVKLIREYATKFGLDHTSGVEITEQPPELTNTDPERSAMGQGTHSYTNVQLSRYVAAIANRGTVFELSLIDKVTDSKGSLIQDYTPEISSKVEIQESTWDAVQTGMRQVVAAGSAKNIFKDLEVEIAGKTGTAQESKTRGNHAFFISYAPYNKPEICVTVNIPNGYSSSNAAGIAKNVYRLYYGYTNLDQIMNNGALNVMNVKISGD